jgi:hypothetical protein
MFKKIILYFKKKFPPEWFYCKDIPDNYNILYMGKNVDLPMYIGYLGVEYKLVKISPWRIKYCCFDCDSMRWGYVRTDKLEKYGYDPEIVY